MQKSTFLDPLFSFFENLHPVPETLKLDYLLNCSLINIKKNKFIISPIDHNESLFFIISGCVRGFVKDRNKDITTRFAFEGELIGAIRHPDGIEIHSKEYLQALEDCTLIRIPYSVIELAYSKYPEAHIVGRKIFSLHYYMASERAILARIPMAADRYETFLKSGACQMDRVPLRCLASYLGMRMETLSRIRAAEQVK